MPNPPPRSDFSPIPVRGKHGLAGNKIPWINPADLIITENVEITDPLYRPLAPGTPHPRIAAAVLISEQQGKSDGSKATVTRIYATRLTAQESVNARHKYEADLNGYPTFIRTFIIPATDYELGKYPGTKLVPLDSVVRIEVTNPGSGYAGNPAATISAPVIGGFTCAAVEAAGAIPSPTQTAGLGFTGVTLGTSEGTLYLYIDATQSPAEGILFQDQAGTITLGDVTADGSGNLVFPGPNPAFTVTNSYRPSVASVYAITPVVHAQAIAQVMNGEVAAIWVTTSGSGYLNDGVNNPTVTIAAPPAGMAATAIAIMQYGGSVLVSEETGPIDEPELMDLSPYYIKVTQTFQAIPGPVLKEFSYNERGEEVTTITQTVSALVGVDADGLLVEKADLNITGPTAARTFATVASRVTLTEKRLGDLSLFPEKFRFSIEVDETSVLIAPSTAPTTLTSTLVQSVIAPISLTKSERKDTSLANTTWPTFTGHEVSVATWGAKASIVETMVADGTAPSTGLQLVSSEVSTLGNGWSLKRDTVFQDPNAWPGLTSKQLGYERAIPGKWRANLEFDTAKSKVAPGTTLTPLGSGVVISAMTAETVDRSELEVTTLIGTPGTLTGYEYSVSTWGQTGSIVEDFVADGTRPATGINVISSMVDTTGTGYSERKTLVLPAGWGTLIAKQLGAMQAIPEKFRITQGTTTVHSKVAPSSSPDALTGGVIESIVIPETIDRSEKRTTSITGNTFPELDGAEVSRETLGGVAEVVETIVVTGSGDDVADTGFNILSSETTPLGNGYTLKRTVDNESTGWPTLTDKALGGVNLIPEKFRAALEIDTVKSKVTPSTSPTALSSTVIESRVIAETKDRSELQVASLSSGTLPTLTGYEVSIGTWGAIASVVESLVTTGSGDTPATGIGILDSRATPLGNNKSVLSTTSLTWPTAGLTEKKLGGIDAIPAKFRIGAEFDTVRTKVAPSTAPTALSGTVFASEVVGETKDRSELRVTSLSGSFPTSFVGFKLNAKGQAIGITEKLVADNTRPTLDPSFEGSQVVALGNGTSMETDENFLNVSGTVPADVFYGYRQTGGSAGSLLEATIRSFIDANGGTPAGFPDVGTNVISDEIVEDTVQRSIRIVKKLVTATGTDPTLPIVYTQALEYDKATKVQLYRDYSIALATATPPTLGAVYPAGSSTFVIDARITPIGAAPYFSRNAILEVEYCAIPAPWVEFPMVGMEFPALFKFASNYFINSTVAYEGGFTPPWPGDGTTPGTFQLVAHRQAVRQARRLHTYTNGPSLSTPESFKVITPGVSSKFFSIPANCIHAPITISQTSTVGGVTMTYQIENIPASSPSAYLTTQILTHSCEERRIFGNIFERILTEISEETPPSQFGDIFATVSFAATVQPKILAQPDAAGESLWLVSSDAGDTQTCIVYGRHGATVIRERIALNGLTFVQTANRFQKLYHLHIGSSPAGTVLCLGSGVPKAGLLDFNGATLADGDTVTVGRTGATQTYRFKDTMAAANDIQRVVLGGSTLDIPSTLINLAEAVNGTATQGAAGSGASCFTGTAATANIGASIDATDTTVIHFADSTDLQANSNTYVLSVSFAGTAPVVVAFAGGADGPELCAVPAGTTPPDAYQVEYFNNPGLLTDAEAITLGGVQEGSGVVSASSDGSSTIVFNVPATVDLVSDGIGLPSSVGGYWFVLCLAGNPSITPTYEISTNSGSTWSSGAVTLPTIGNGKVFESASLTDTALVTPTAATQIRVKVDNTGSNLARAIHVALSYQVV